MGAPAGWYRDPAMPWQGRFWDGAQWTANVTAIPVGQDLPTLGTVGPAPFTPAGQAAPAGVPPRFSPSAFVPPPPILPFPARVTPAPKSKAPWFVGLAVVAVLALGAAGFVVVSGDSKPSLRIFYKGLWYHPLLMVRTCAYGPDEGPPDTPADCGQQPHLYSVYASDTDPSQGLEFGPGGDINFDFGVQEMSITKDGNDYRLQEGRWLEPVGGSAISCHYNLTADNEGPGFGGRFTPATDCTSNDGTDMTSDTNEDDVYATSSFTTVAQQRSKISKALSDNRAALKEPNIANLSSCVMRRLTTGVAVGAFPLPLNSHGQATDPFRNYAIGAITPAFAAALNKCDDPGGAAYSLAQTLATSFEHQLAPA